MGKGFLKIFVLVAFLLALTLSCSLNMETETEQADAVPLDQPLAAVSTQKIIRASDRQSNDFFGTSVGLSGNYAIVGASDEDGGAGNPAFSAGAAYIYERDTSGTWSQKALLRASDKQAWDLFGQNVAISGNYAIVGAPLEDGGSGDPVNGAGAAYIFERISGRWTQRSDILRASDVANSYNFGIEVAISGSYAAVASYNDAVYIFYRSSTTGKWTQQARIANANGGANFGEHIGIDGDKVIIGATDAVVFYHRSGTSWVQKNFLSITPGSLSRVALGISGNYAIAGTPPYGAYIFEYNSTWGTWGHKAFVQSSDYSAEDEFGYSVSLSGTYAAVGAYAKNAGRGAAYVFTRQSGSWLQSQMVTASDAQMFDDFGTSVDLNSSHYLIVGAPFEFGGSGDPIPSCGTGYIFE